MAAFKLMDSCIVTTFCPPNPSCFLGLIYTLDHAIMKRPLLQGLKLTLSMTLLPLSFVQGPSSQQSSVRTGI